MIMNFQVTEYTYFITTSNYDFNFIALKDWIVTLAAYFNTFFNNFSELQRYSTSNVTFFVSYQKELFRSLSFTQSFISHFVYVFDCLIPNVIAANSIKIIK